MTTNTSKFNRRRHAITALILFVAAASLVVPVVHHRAPSITAPPARPGTRTPRRQPTHPYVLNPRAEAEALSWVERMLAAAPDRMQRQEDEADSSDARTALSAIIRKYGPSVRAYDDLGTCELHSYCGIGNLQTRAHYEEAVSAFSRAAYLSPSDATAAAGLKQARKLLHVSHALRPSLPDDEVVLQLRPFPRPVPGRSWIALCGKRAAPPIQNARDYPGAPLTLRLFVPDGSHYRCLWTVPGGREDESLWSAAVYVENLFGGRLPQVILHRIFTGGDTTHSLLDVYAWQGGHMVRILDLEGDEPLWVQDIRHNGVYQVWSVTDYTHDFDGGPFWSDCYAWNGKKFYKADRQYAVAFRQRAHDLRQALKDDPDNIMLLGYLGGTCEILGRVNEANRAFMAAQSAVIRTIPDSQGADDWYLGCEGVLSDLYESVNRPDRARQLYRSIIRKYIQAARREKTVDARNDDLQEIKDWRTELAGIP